MLNALHNAIAGEGIFVSIIVPRRFTVTRARDIASRRTMKTRLVKPPIPRDKRSKEFCVAVNFNPPLFGFFGSSRLTRVVSKTKLLFRKLITRRRRRRRRHRTWTSTTREGIVERVNYPERNILSLVVGGRKVDQDPVEKHWRLGKDPVVVL